MSITPIPQRLLCDADAYIECESIIDIPASELIELIVRAGWPRKDVAAALTDDGIDLEQRITVTHP